MMKYERERILIKTEMIDFEQFDNKSLSNFIEYFTALQESYKTKFPNNEHIITIYNYGYDGGYEFNINVYEYESDIVYKTRMEKLDRERKKIEEKKLEKERKVYEELKKKFEKQLEKNNEQ